MASHWNSWQGRKVKPSGAELPPTAEHVAGCPPHYWRLDLGWQECRKCGERKRQADAIKRTVGGTQ
jgi:hypothetical protein